LFYLGINDVGITVNIGQLVSTLVYSPISTLTCVESLQHSNPMEARSHWWSLLPGFEVMLCGSPDLVVRRYFWPGIFSSETNFEAIGENIEGLEL
jgi:hypothetical protein